MGLAITTTFDNGSGARRHILGTFHPYHLLYYIYGSVSCSTIQCHYDYEGVPNVIWIASREAGYAQARLYHVAFKSGLTGRHLPRELGGSVGYETLGSRKVCFSCSGLEWCAAKGSCAALIASL